MNRSVVMIHGMHGGGWYWQNFKTFFEEKGYRCFAPYLRYHDVDPAGQPDPALGTISLLDYVNDMEDFIRGLDEAPIIMGHSMGGLIAQLLGARGLADALVLLTPAAPSGINAATYSVIKSFWGVMTTWGFWRKPFRPSMKSMAYAIMHRIPMGERKKMYDKLVHESGRAAFEIGLWHMDSKHASKVDETKIICPVLIVSGSEDRITPASVIKKIARKYRHVATYKEFDHHAHLIIGEPGWEDVARYVDEWIRGTA